MDDSEQGPDGKQESSDAYTGDSDGAPDTDPVARASDHDDTFGDDNPTCTDKDVLMGRGKRVSEWPGNRFFREIINQYRVRYNVAQRAAKVAIAKEVIAAVHAAGGRFLKEAGPVPSNGAKGVHEVEWEEIDTPRAIEKACQALREKISSMPSKKELKRLASKQQPQFDGSQEDTVDSAAGTSTTSTWQQQQPQVHSTLSAERKRKARHGAFSGAISKQAARQSPPPPPVPHTIGSRKQQETTAPIHHRLVLSASAETAGSVRSSSPAGMRQRQRRNEKDRDGGDSASNGDKQAKSQSQNGEGMDHGDDAESSAPFPAWEDYVTAAAMEELDEGVTSSMTVSMGDIQRLESNKMLQLLRRFKQENEHVVAVQPADLMPASIRWLHFAGRNVGGMKSALQLADWCSAQRQVYREIQSGYREATPHETQVLEALTAMGFVWDFAEWHWQHQYSELSQKIVERQRQQQQGTTNDGATVANADSSTTATRVSADAAAGTSNGNMTELHHNGNPIAIQIEESQAPSTAHNPIGSDDDAAAATTGSTLSVDLPAHLRVWLDDQKDQYDRIGPWLIPYDRREKLRNAGIFLL